METSTSALIMPEVILYKTLKTVFKLIKDDFNSAPSPEKSMLYSLFGKDEDGIDLEFEEFNYFKQAQETFVKKSPQVNIGYNLEVAAMGCVHILLPAETGNPLTLGADEDGGNYVYNDPTNPTDFKEVFNQRYESTYNMLITSENTFEVIMIYNLLKASLLALNSHLELAGLKLPKQSGQDLNVQSDLVPTTIFHRSLMINFIYEISVPSFFYKKLVKNFTIIGEMTDTTP